MTRDGKLTADGEEVADSHMISRTYDLKSRLFAELFEKMFLPRGDPRSRALTDRLATMGMVNTPVQHHTKYFSSDLVIISTMLLQSERNDEPPVSTQ